TNQIVRHLRQPIHLIVGPTVDDGQVLALDVTGVLQSGVKSAQTVCVGFGRRSIEESDHWHWLLRTRDVRHRACGRRAADERDEFAPSHSITSSARSRMDVGTVIPNSLAVFMFKYNSNVVGSCTGRSDGFSPLRIRPV